MCFGTKLLRRLAFQVTDIKQFCIEALARGLAPEGLARIRREKTAPLFDDLEA